MRLAAALGWLSGLGFGVPGVYGTWYHAEYGHVWTFMGFPAYSTAPGSCL